MSASFTFDDLFYSLVFLLSIWIVGKLFSLMGLPALVGEMAVGVLMGPHGLEVLDEHFVDSWKLIGEIGLLLLVLEAGLDVDIAMLKIIGLRGAVVALLGSIIPMGIGMGLAIAMGSEIKAALSIGATLAPTSMGIALNVLRKGHQLNAPTGQLIIAAAVLDDVLALIILSEIEASGEENPTALSFILPVLVSALFILIFGYLAVNVLPIWLETHMAKVKTKRQREFTILAFLFATVLVMIPACYYMKSSYLLGSFLAGLLYCTDHTAHEAWIDQVKRIMQWLLRIFFACTIGFEIPIRDFWSPKVLGNAVVYMLAILGKLSAGFWAAPFKASEFWKIAFAMSAWGEFAFIIATYSHEHEIMTDDEYSSVILAVMLSVVISPVALSLVIKHYNKKMKEISKDIESHTIGDIAIKPAKQVYYSVDIKTDPSWEQHSSILAALKKLEVQILDFRRLKVGHREHEFLEKRTNSRRLKVNSKSRFTRHHHHRRDSEPIIKHINTFMKKTPGGMSHISEFTAEISSSCSSFSLSPQATTKTCPIPSNDAVSKWKDEEECDCSRELFV